MNWYWGDLHCHTNLSYGRGTMERAFAIARQHLDFWSITGHAFWPDISTDLQHDDAIISMHLGGFAKCRQYWPRLLELTAEARAAGLIAFPGFEWHSNCFGDHNVIGFDPDLDLIEPANVAEFSNAYTTDRHLLIPHHIGYTKGQRGIDWDAFRESDMTGLIEVFSNHGSAMSDDGSYDYFHTMGPRDGAHTIDHALRQGIRCGFIASTDSHDGFPGHYSHGRTGVLATEKSPEAIWDALRARRVVAATGAKIETDISLNDAGIGEVIHAPAARRLSYTLQGNQPFRDLSIVKNGHVIHRNGNLNPAPSTTPGRYRCKIEWGWGEKDRAVAWDCALEVHGGRLLGVEPCFRHTAFDLDTNDPPHAITGQGDTSLHWHSVTRGVPDAFVHNPETMTSGVNALVVDIEATEQTVLAFRSNVLDFRVDWSAFQAGSVVSHAAGHQSPAVRLKRPYAIEDCTLSAEICDHETSGLESDSYYVRATQIDGESIWVTPIWATR